MQQIEKEADRIRQREHELQRSGRIAVRTAIVSHLILMFCVIVVSLTQSESIYQMNILSHLVVLVCWNVVFGGVVLPASHFCAWLSHQLFYTAQMKVNYATISMAIVAMLTINGWVYLSFMLVNAFPQGC